MSIIQRVRELSSQGLSYRKIAKKLKREKVANISKSTVARICNGFEPKEKIQEARLQKPQDPRKRRLTLAEIIGESEFYDEELEGVLTSSGRERESAEMIRNNPIEQEASPN